MRLIEKKIGYNPVTFAPELLVTVAIELTTDLDPNTVKSDAEWGREFLQLVTEKGLTEPLPYEKLQN
jgi:hypothetical protein